MFVRHVKVSGLLSFGPSGIDLPMENLNVLIGPNGSGKSNFLEVLALLRASPTNLPEPVKEMGGVHEWLWKGEASIGEACIDVVLGQEKRKPNLRHVLQIADHGGRFEVVDERIENEHPLANKKEPYFYYRFQKGHPLLNDLSKKKPRGLKRESVKPELSILSQMRDPESYPVLHWLQEQYAGIRMYRNWSFGPGAAWRREVSAHARGDALNDGGDNLALVLSNIVSRPKTGLLESLTKLFDGIQGVGFEISGGNVLLRLSESGGRSIPATRLSDGTLRYLSLLAILLQGTPPPLVAIEEPELGLHPDILPHLAELLVRASERTQLVITTHSRLLVDALSGTPSSIVVCQKENGESRFDRLDATELEAWLQKYSLGNLWSMGELGGNRW